MRHLRWRAALAGTAVLVGIAPALASAYTPALRCRDAVPVGSSFQRIPIERFQPIQGVNSTDTVTGYNLSANRPQHVVVTNGKRLKVSNTNGCAWNDGLALPLEPTPDLPLSGTTSTIVSTAITANGRVLAAVREGTGPASRPHVVTSDNGRNGYRMSDSGLPPQGSPQFLKAADDDRTVYLVLTPTSDDGGPVPGTPLPGIPGGVTSPTGSKAGLLYASTDQGRSWALRTSPEDIPAGGGGLDRLAIDRQNPNKLYAISNGLLLVSSNGGATFTRGPVDGETVSAVETGPGQVFVFTTSGRLLTSRDGQSFVARKGLAGVTSAAYRRGDSRLAVEANGQLALVDGSTGAVFGLPGVAVTRGSMLGDSADPGSYHGLSGHSLLRYNDPPPVDPIDTPVAVGDVALPPPPLGTISPAARTVQLKVGESSLLDYELAMPKSPTPVDLMFLVDVSDSMSHLISDLKANISKTTSTIQRAGIDLQVGLATIGTGAEADTITTPNTNALTPAERGKQLYELFRPIGPVNGFGEALARVRTKPASGKNNEEAQVIALEQATAGEGLRDPQAPSGVPLYLIPPGQGAGWRQAPGIRRIMVHASDEAFAKPAGTRLKGGRPDIDHAVMLMNQRDVKQLGLSLGTPEAKVDLQEVSRLTRTFAPPGGADCGQEQVLPAGTPLVCDSNADFSEVIGRLVRSLADRQDVSLVARGTGPRVVASLDARRFKGVDVTVANRLPFKVRVTCQGMSAGRYTRELVAGLRGSRVASSRLTIDCIGPAAAVAAARPPVFPAGGSAPAPPPVAQAPAAIVPPAPAAQPQAQPQSQVQTQTQLNPMTAAMMQQQEELQLALALQAGERERPQTREEMAMVGRQRPDDSAALILLATAMAASAALGLARLRSRPNPSPARVRR